MRSLKSELAAQNLSAKSNICNVTIVVNEKEPDDETQSIEHNR